MERAAQQGCTALQSFALFSIDLYFCNANAAQLWNGLGFEIVMAIARSLYRSYSLNHLVVGWFLRTPILQVSMHVRCSSNALACQLGTGGVGQTAKGTKEAQNVSKLQPGGPLDF